MQTPFVSIILPVFNEERHLEACLTALSDSDYPRNKFEIITVDNGSSDKSLSIAAYYADKVLEHVEVNVGAVRNFGAQNAIGSIIVFLDSDCVVSPGWLRTGVDLVLSNPDTVYGGNLYLRDKPAWIEKAWLIDDVSNTAVQHELLGSCIFIKKEVFNKTNGFDETVTSGEDTAFSKSLKSLGYTVLIEPKVGVIHLGNPTTISDFVTRQIWHSENYIAALQDSIRDKMFWLVVFYLVCMIGIVVSVFEPLESSLILVFLFLAIPALLSVRRILKAKFKSRQVLHLLQIYLVDHLYLIARSIGLLKGCIKIKFND